MKRIILALALLVSAPALAFDIPELKAPVNDYARLLTPVQIGQLNDRLRSIEAASGDDAQFVILTLPSLADESIDKVRNDVFHAWKLGRSGKDNGVLLIIAPVERKIGIEVGYGLEPFLPDGLTKTITEEKIKPHLKRGSEDWFKAIDSGVQAIGAVVVSREKPAAPTERSSIFWPVTLFGGALAGVGFFLVGASRRRTRQREEAELAAAALRRTGANYAPRPSNLTAAAIGAGAGYAMASKPRPAPKPTPTRPASRSSSYDSSPSYSPSYSSSSSSSSSSDSGSSYSGGGGDSGGGGSSSDF